MQASDKNYTHTDTDTSSLKGELYWLSASIVNVIATFMCFVLFIALFCYLYILYITQME